MGTQDRQAAGIVPDRLQRWRSKFVSDSGGWTGAASTSPSSIRPIDSAGVKCITGPLRLSVRQLLALGANLRLDDLHAPALSDRSRTASARCGAGSRR